MLVLAILLNNLLPSDHIIHVTHTVWYFLRSFLFEPETKTVQFDDKTYHVPYNYMNVILVPVVSLLLSIPQLWVSDISFVPYAIVHIMGYNSPVWFTVIHGAFFTVYAALRPQVLMVIKAAFLSKYITNDFKHISLYIAAACHLAMHLCTHTSFETIPYTPENVIIGVLLAEAKLTIMFKHTWNVEVLFPTLDPRSIWCLPVFLGNIIMTGWYRHWTYTDKVWRDPNITYIVLNIAMAYGMWSNEII